MKRGFTLVEMLLAVTILGIMTAVTAISFNSVINNWKKSEDVVDRMQGAEYMLTQVIAGLKSAYYPNDGQFEDNSRGLMLIDGGEGEEPDESDMIEWTKLGPAIVGNRSQLAETSHRVQIWVSEGEDTGNGEEDAPGLYARVWNTDLMTDENKITSNDDDFNEKFGWPFLLVEDVVGMDVKVQKTDEEVDSEGRAKWENEWSTSNQIPFRVQITFRMKPPEGEDESTPILRIVELPVWELSQGKVENEDTAKEGGADKGGKSGGKGGSTGGAPGGGVGGRGGGVPGGGRGGGGVPGGGRGGGVPGGRMPPAPPGGGMPR